MKISYFNEDYDLIAETTDFIPTIGEFVTIKDIDYKVVDKKIVIENSETKISVWVE